MNLTRKFLLLVVGCVLSAVGNANIMPGGNLTEFTGDFGIIQQNHQNNMFNNRVGTGAAGAPTASFRNCVAALQRCVGQRGSTDMAVVRPIVVGCLQGSTPECRGYGDDLINYVASNIVRVHQDRAQAAQQQLAAQQAAAAGAQNQQLQQQMAEMQQQLAQQQAQSQQQMQQMMAEQAANLAAQQAAMAAQQQQATATNPNPQSDMQRMAEAGVSADMIARQQQIGQILTQLDGVNTGLSAMRATVRDVMDYAGCNHNATECEGPRRVAVFRRKANAFFEPVDNVIDSLERALSMAMVMGVDISDIHMMLNNTCSQWARYFCQSEGTTQAVVFCPPNQEPNWQPGRRPLGNRDLDLIYNRATEIVNGSTVVHNNCTIAQSQTNTRQFVNPDCQFMGLLENRADVLQSQITEGTDEASRHRVACAGNVLQAGGLFGGRRRQAQNQNRDIADLEDLIMFDEPRSARTDQHANMCNINNSGATLRAVIRTGDFGAIPSRTDQEDADRIRATAVQAAMTAAEAALPAGSTQQQINTAREAARIEAERTGAIADGRPARGLFVDRQGGNRACNPDDVGCEYINPIFALCTTHAFNIGATANPAEGGREIMREAIGLKSTVIVNQMRRHQQFIESQVRAIRERLERAIMVANAEAAGADRDRTTGAAAQQLNLRGCRLLPPDQMPQCLRDDMNTIDRALPASGNVTGHVLTALRAFAVTAAQNVPEDRRGAIETACPPTGTVSVQTARNCLGAINAGINAMPTQRQGVGGGLNPAQAAAIGVLMGGGN